MLSSVVKPVKLLSASQKRNKESYKAHFDRKFDRKWAAYHLQHMTLFNHFRLKFWVVILESRYVNKAFVFIKWCASSESEVPWQKCRMPTQLLSWSFIDLNNIFSLKSLKVTWTCLRYSKLIHSIHVFVWVVLPS